MANAEFSKFAGILSAALTQHRLFGFVIEGEKVEVVTDFLFLGSKITADGGRSHEIRRHLLLGRKAMTNPDSVLKSRDITLPTKVCTFSIHPCMDVRVGP